MTMPTSVPVKKSPESVIVGAIGALQASGHASFHRLKRGTDLLDAMLEAVFHETKATLREQHTPVNDELLALALLLLPRLDADGKRPELMKALSQAGFTELRLGTLMRCEEPDELFTHLQRAVRYCKNKVCPFHLTRLILGWTEANLPKHRRKLLAEFYA